jgi:integrase
MSKAWVFQKTEDVRNLGAGEAPWYVGWYEPGGNRRKKSCGAGTEGKKNAERKRRKLEAQLIEGTYRSQAGKTWEDFRREYDQRVLAGLAPATRATSLISLDHFERLIRPKKVFALSAESVARFVAARRQERGRNRGETVSPATVNKDLRHLKAALAVAEEWGYLDRAPKVRMERAGRKLPRYVTGDHFAALYAACEHARKPADVPNVAPADWWRALLVTGYMTGWRIGDMLGLRREDVDLDAGTAVIRWETEGNKGRRDELVKLHPVVIEHWRKVVVGFDPCVLPWNHHRRTLDEEWLAIQQAAGIRLVCRKQHEHTEHCQAYGFHDLRRAFATMNADKLTPDALQALMRHKSYQTTQLYINMARQMDAAVASLHVPDVLRRAGAGQ